MSIWKICNWLFGWDYISWQNSADQGVSRIYKSNDGKPAFYFRYRLTGVVDRVGSNREIWLTCSPSKYKTSPQKEH